MTLLYLDIDGKLPSHLVESITQTLRFWRWPIVAVRVDRTKRGWHVVVGVEKRLNAVSIVAAQAILGSDPKREMFNLTRARRLRFVAPQWRKQWNVLYSRHTRNLKLVS
jgi:hypothetical protein